MKLLKLLFVFLLLNSCESKQSTSPRFNHLMLSVTDLDASIKFYTTGFDLQVTNKLKKIEVFNEDGTTLSRDVNMAFLKFPNQNFVLELSETPTINSENPSPFYQHLGVDVQNIEKAFNRLKKIGAEVLVPIRLVKADGVEAKQAFFKGPNGEPIELMEIISGVF